MVCCRNVQLMPTLFLKLTKIRQREHFRIFSASDSTRVRFGRSRSSKVDDFGTNRKRVGDFLLVGHCDYGPILHRFRDMLTYWLKIAYLCYILPTPLSFGALAPYVPFGIFR